MKPWVWHAWYPGWVHPSLTWFCSLYPGCRWAKGLAGPYKSIWGWNLYPSLQLHNQEPSESYRERPRDRRETRHTRRCWFVGKSKQTQISTNKMMKTQQTHWWFFWNQHFLEAVGYWTIEQDKSLLLPNALKVCVYAVVAGTVNTHSHRTAVSSTVAIRVCCILSSVNKKQIFWSELRTLCRKQFVNPKSPNFFFNFQHCGCCFTATNPKGALENIKDSY